MKVLIACEESQIVCKEFREKGHEAYSCDIQDCSGNFPEWHIKDNVFNIINDNWDIMIGHPPCTFLSFAGSGWFNVEKYGQKAILREIEKQKAIDFFLKLFNSPIKKICLENPMGYIHNVIKCNQIIQPYYFGDNDQKRTCLWLKNLPKLTYDLKDNLFFKQTSVDKPKPIIYKDGKKRYFTDTIRCYDADLRRKLRSKTFLGIAKAMANQWG